MALTDKLTAIADGFRSSRGTTEGLSLEEMAVLAAEKTGITPEGTLDITENGTYDVTQYAEANVNVPTGGDGGYVFENTVNLGIEVVVLDEAYVTFTSACYENKGGTELTGTIDVSAGDWVLATVTTRSATTLPSDWTVLKESTVLNADALNQRMFFLCKQATADGTESITITQTDSVRIYINLLAAKSATGFAYHEGTEVYSDTEKLESITVARPDYNLLVWGCTANLWNTSAPYGEWACSGLTAICLGQASTQPRQANFVDRTSAESRTFECGVEDGTFYIIDCVEVLY